MSTTTNPQLADLDRFAAPTRRRSTWKTLLSAAVVLGVVAACSATGSQGETAAGGQGDRAGAAPTATAVPTAAASSSGAPSSRPSTTASIPPNSAGSLRAACTANKLLALKRKFDGRSPGADTRVQIERCRNDYARVFSPASEGEQIFLRYLNGSWRSVSEGTGLSCSDSDISRALLRACTALGYRTTAHLDRITDPQVAADRLVDAWMRHDSAAAGQLTRDESPIEVLFSEQAPTTTPEAIPCRLLSPGRFACSYTLAPRAQLTIIVAGGASAGYEVTGLEFGD
jgi:hypothetical protein